MYIQNYLASEGEDNQDAGKVKLILLNVEINKLNNETRQLE